MFAFPVKARLGRSLALQRASRITVGSFRKSVLVSALVSAGKRPSALKTGPPTPADGVSDAVYKIRSIRRGFVLKFNPAQRAPPAS